VGQGAETKPAPWILYVTSLPGTHHDYVTQREIFLETAKRAGWDVTPAGMEDCSIARDHANFK
jgi:hypothetical protein